MRTKDSDPELPLRPSKYSQMPELNAQCCCLTPLALSADAGIIGHAWNQPWRYAYVACVFLAFHTAMFIFYLVVRCAKSLDIYPRSYRGYAIFVLIMECLGWTTVLNYGLNNLRRPLWAPWEQVDDRVSTAAHPCPLCSLSLWCIEQKAQCSACTASAGSIRHCICTKQLAPCHLLWTAAC